MGEDEGRQPLSPPMERPTSPSRFSWGVSSVSGTQPCQRSTSMGIYSAMALLRISGSISLTSQ